MSKKDTTHYDVMLRLSMPTDSPLAEQDALASEICSWLDGLHLTVQELKIDTRRPERGKQR